tara:strand:- start:18337 stop:18639 length:303 start_codon:yes stop_codon:yes gene_type:complete
MACHCTQCRKTTGHYLSATQVPTANLTIAGDTLAWFQSSPEARRGFCVKCGSSLFWQQGGREMTSVMTGTLDGATGLTTSTHIHLEDKGDYYAIPESEIE